MSERNKDSEQTDFDRLCQKVASGFDSTPEEDGIAEIESAVKSLRDGCDLTDRQLPHLIEEASKELGDIAADHVRDARTVLDGIRDERASRSANSASTAVVAEMVKVADQRYTRILAGEKTIPWAEAKSALIARLESAHLQ